MQSNTTVAKKMVEYLEKHDLTVPALSTTNPYWGKGKKQAAWRVTTHAEMHPATQKTQQLCDFLFPLTPAQKLRRGIVAGYKSLVGVREGSAKQKAIAAFCGLSWTQPWCAETAWYVLRHEAGFAGNGPANRAYVPSWELWAKSKGLLVDHSKALAGMYITFRWDGGKGVGTGNHIGIITQPGLMRHTVQFSVGTTEGNTGGYSGVDGVYTEKRWWYQTNCIIDPARLQK